MKPPPLRPKQTAPADPLLDERPMTLGLAALVVGKQAERDERKAARAKKRAST